MPPIKTKFKGPAIIATDQNADDFVDEVLDTFRANMLFKNFEIKGDGDRLLVYLTLYAHQALKKLENQNKKSAEGVVYQLAISSFSLPSEGILKGMVPVVAPGDQEKVKAYITQLRQEVGLRLVQRVFKNDENNPCKFWMQFTKRKFLNKELTT